MKNVNKIATASVMVLMMLMVSGCSKQYSFQHDWDRIDFEKITKPPAPKKV